MMDVIKDLTICYAFVSVSTGIALYLFFLGASYMYHK